MAQSKTVLALLATAVALASTIDNAELNASIEALKAQENANGNTQEYKDLKDLLDTIDAQANTGTDKGPTPPADKGPTQNGADTGTPPTPTVDGTDGADVKTGDDGVTGDGADVQNGANAGTPQAQTQTDNTDDTQNGATPPAQNGAGTQNGAVKKTKKLNYIGIKQIGSLWYSSKDNYKKSFSTADECAEHFNR